MRESLDRWIAAAALGLLLAVALLVGLLVQDAQQHAIESREQLREETVRQLAGQMDSRVTSALLSLGPTIGAPGKFTLRPGDASDSAAIATLFPGDPTAGGYLVDANRRIVNGFLLRPPTAIGGVAATPGLDGVLRGTGAILPVAAGLTTADPVIPIALPTRDAEGAVDGAFVLESAVAPDSAFNDEIAQLRAGRTGSFSFIDGAGVVVASSDASKLAKPVSSAVRSTRPGHLRRVGEQVVVVADVPSADWRLAFEQSIDEFQGDVTGPVRRALLLLLGGAAIAGAVAVVSLLRRLRSSREEQRRLAEINAAREEFTSIVSHELRTPVAGLLGFLETAIDHWDDMSDDDRRRAVQRSYANARSLRSLTADVLDSTSIEAHTLALHPEDLDLRVPLAETVSLMRAIDPDRVINVVEPDASVRVYADPSRIGQVISNLVDNAVKGSPAGSPIDISLAVDGREAVLSVRDRGSGIPVADLDRVFEKFVRGPGVVGRGTGLGLYISRHLVEAHGGRIWAELAPDAGACISFRLPLAVAVPAEQTAPVPQ